MENKKYDLEKAKEDCRRHEDALEEAQSCMCGHCHECGFDPSEMKAALDEVERLRSLEKCISPVIDRQGKTNAALLGQLDVISAYLDTEMAEWKNGDQIAEIAIKFMDRQKQNLNDANSQIAAKDARIDLLDSDQKRYHAAWMAAEEDKEEQAARIKELEAEVEAKNKQIRQDIIDKPTEEADWVADYHLLQSALDGPIIDAARKWHAAYRKAQNSNLMRAKEVERLRSENRELKKTDVWANDVIKEHESLNARINGLEAEIERLSQPNDWDDYGNPIIVSVTGGPAEGKIGGGDGE